jgi:hypothetical protein
VVGIHEDFRKALHGSAFTISLCFSEEVFNRLATRNLADFHVEAYPGHIIYERIATLLPIRQRVRSCIDVESCPDEKQIHDVLNTDKSMV